MGNRRIKIHISGGGMKIDFSGFPGGECHAEEEKITAIFGLLGVNVNVCERKIEDLQEPSGVIIAQRERA